MGKASSSKKVARAASTGGGRTSRGRRPIGYYSFISLVVILGTLILITSRQDLAPASATPPTTKDHWHAAYGIYICKSFVPPLADKGADRLGIHTHGDGLAHVHPFSARATGANATFGKLADQTGLKLSSTEIGVPGQKTRKNGDKCGKQKAEVKAVVWDNVTAKGRFVGGNPRDIPLKQGEIITIAFVPEDTKVEKIPKPASVAELSNPSDLQTPPSSTPEGTTPSSTPAESSTTAPPTTKP
jgi:hypothetical protein